MNPVVKKILKIFGWIIASIILLIVLVFILIQIPAVQNFAKDKAVNYLQKKIGTKVAIGRLSIEFPKRIVLQNVYFEDQKKDTLLAGKEIRVDIALLKLLSSEVNVNYLELNGIRSHIYRVQPDTSFNFEYIVKAFAGEQKKETTPQDTTSALKFHLNKIVFKDILTTFKDDETGNDVYFYLGNFETRINKFDPDHQVFDIKEIAVANINARVYQYKPLIQKITDTAAIVQATESSSMPSVQLNSLSFKNIKFNYRNDVSALLADLNIGELNTHPDKLDLQNLYVRLKDIKLNNTKAQIVLGKTQQANITKEVVANKTENELANPWRFELGKIDFNNNDLNYDDNNKPKAFAGMDFSHMHIKGFIFHANGLNFTPSEYKGNIQQIAFTEQSGFDLRKFQTQFVYNDKSTALENLLIETDKSQIKDKITLQYPSISALSKTPGELFIDADLKQSSIAAKDILTFMPAFKRNLRGNEGAIIKINTSVKGYVRDLSIPVFELSGIGNTYVKLSGNIKGLPDAKKTYYDINVAQLHSTKNDLVKFLPAKALPSSVRLPDVISLSGFFKGGMKAFNTQLALRTNRGNIDVKGQMNGREAYSAKLSVNNLQAGYLLKQEKNLGNITLNAKVKGTGLDMKTANLHYDANIITAQLKGYNYRNLSLKGDVNRGIVQTAANINDENISLNLNVTADIKPKYPALQLDLLLDTINLRALNLTTDTMSLHGHIIADMPVTNPDSLNGTVTINDLIVTNAGKTLSTDSIALVASATAEQKNININVANAISANLTGQYKLTEIGQALQHTINQYYNLPGFKEKNFSAQNWELNARIIPEGLVLQLMPDLKGSDSILIRTAFKSADNNLNVAVRNGRLIFGGQQIDSLKVTAQTNANRLEYNVSVEGVKTPSINLYKTAFAGYVADNKLDFGLNVKDQKNTSQYVLGGLLNQIKNGVQLSLKDSLMLDYSKWDVGQGNFIQYDSTAGILVNNFTIGTQGQSIAINSTPPTINSPIKIDFSNFRIGTITKMAHKDSLLLDGVINGNAVVSDVMKNPIFTSDLTINNVVYKKDTIGNLIVKVNNQTANAFAANVSITGNNNDINLNGMYYTGEGRMDMKLALNQVNLSIVKPFAIGQLNDISGTLKGNVNIAGTIKQPSVNGDLHFQNAFITPAITGERFSIPDETINITPQGIHFDQFTLLDSAKDAAIIDGDIFTTDFKSFNFNVDLNADNFRAVNTTKKTDQLFYGKLNIDTDVKLRGTMEAPTVEANLRINKATDFTLVLPSNDPEVVSREGVVVFVDKDHPDSARLAYTTDTISNKSDLRGFDVTANIETDSAAAFTVVIDERNGDALTLKGRADLAGGIDKSGKVSLTGNYELQSGSYQLSLNFLKRKFTIQKGSTITWTGDPKSANLDLTAIYVANTPSIDLVEQQLNGASTIIYKEKLPFEVNLKMQGELLKPIITFDITLPEDELSRWPVVDQRLQQVRSDESELNKQVFALLLLGRFVGQNPLQSSAEGAGVAGAVRQSASRILTDQLNQLAGNLISGVDINFDLNSQQDYSTGTAANRTDLNVGLSKSLLNDRLRVNVGSNFELEGPQNSNRAASNIAGDVSVDYQVSKDGRYLLRAYRRNQYEGVIEGQVIETGLSFILTFDYNEFKELFEGRKEAKKIRKAKKAKSTNAGTATK